VENRKTHTVWVARRNSVHPVKELLPLYILAGFLAEEMKVGN